jgi:hypothetical protein
MVNHRAEGAFIILFALRGQPHDVLPSEGQGLGHRRVLGVLPQSTELKLRDRDDRVDAGGAKRGKQSGVKGKFGCQAAGYATVTSVVVCQA